MLKTYGFVAALVLATGVLTGCGGTAPASQNDGSVNLRQGNGQGNGQGMQKRNDGSEEGAGDGVQMRNGGVPPEAVSACEGKSEGDECEMILRRDNQKVPGSCELLPTADQLSCAPKFEEPDQPIKSDQPAPPEDLGGESEETEDIAPEQQ